MKITVERIDASVGYEHNRDIGSSRQFYRVDVEVEVHGTQSMSEAVRVVEERLTRKEEG